MNRIRVALVGCGYIAQAEHLPNLHNNPDFALIAVVEPQPQLAARITAALGLPVYATLTECLDREALDAVIIASPRQYHPALIAEAAAAGKHVLTEKPLAGTAAEAQPAVEAAQRAGIILLVGYMRRYESDSLEALRLLRSGAIGDPVAAVSRFQLCYRPVFPSPLQWPDPDAYKSASFIAGSLREALLEESIHHITLLRMLLGEPETVLMAGGRPEAYQAVWRAGGALVTHLNVSTLGQGEEVQIYGTDGHISWRLWSPHFPYTFCDLRVFQRSQGEERRPIFPRVNPYHALLQHFAQCIRGEAEPRTPAEDAMRDLVWIERILARAGEPSSSN